MSDLEASRILSCRDVAALTSVSRATVYRMVRDGVLPKPRPIPGTRSRVGWRAEDVSRFLASFNRD